MALPAVCFFFLEKRREDVPGLPEAASHTSSWAGACIFSCRPRLTLSFAGGAGQSTGEVAGGLTGSEGGQGGQEDISSQEGASEELNQMAAGQGPLTSRSSR